LPRDGNSACPKFDHFAEKKGKEAVCLPGYGPAGSGLPSGEIPEKIFQVSGNERLFPRIEPNPSE
jgi:hypothetical protein